MSKNSQDELVRAYAMLSSLRKNISQMTDRNVPEKYVADFHNVLDRLESIGIGVSEFRIPASEVKPKVTDVSPVNNHGGGGGHVSYSKEKYVDKYYLLTKLDALLGYIESITSEKPKQIGFHTERD
ncbi:MAG: hypothetical protein HYX79_00405 [Chloroflexi bacterium]|nr:hypothetical protein [Chloroflexota bacterium]